MRKVKKSKFDLTNLRTYYTIISIENHTCYEKEEYVERYPLEMRVLG
ncbi:protein of unknown function [Petrocella atlantisensis]|uniref:Uncharacterized protein n=1 Tax=Petrocella atlantisensis TaxID=2173034 RepID=A0A3P7P9H0_9FIRM|nr:protein of unknown function [Petrocella atlantisensis]